MHLHDLLTTSTTSMMETHPDLTCSWDHWLYLQESTWKEKEENQDYEAMG